jgi:hypothetical protein
VHSWTLLLVAEPALLVSLEPQNCGKEVINAKSVDPGRRGGAMIDRGGARHAVIPPHAPDLLFG